MSLMVERLEETGLGTNGCAKSPWDLQLSSTMFRHKMGA
jgi:hypothetical protein